MIHYLYHDIRCYLNSTVDTAL